MQTTTDTGFADPRRAHPDRPMTDRASAAVLEEAVVTLTLLRSPMRLGDALAELHATMSLLAEIRQRLPVVVADARDQDHNWSDIAAQLGVTEPTARRQHRTIDTDRS